MRDKQKVICYEGSESKHPVESSGNQPFPSEGNYQLFWRTGRLHLHLNKDSIMTMTPVEWCNTHCGVCLYRHTL